MGIYFAKFCREYSHMLHGAGIFTYKTGIFMVNASKYSIHALGMWDTQF